MRTESSSVPEEPNPEPQTVSPTESESPTNASEDDELHVEVLDLTSQDSGTRKGNGPKYRSRRRRINKKVKERHQSLKKEQEHGHELFMSELLYMSISENK